MPAHPWLADRTAQFDGSGIRKVFDLAAKMKDPINLSIGQPDFPVPEPIKDAAIEAIRGDKNGYSQTQGIAAAARRAAGAASTREYRPRRPPRAGHQRHQRRAGARDARAGQPGDEVIIFDPYFVMYPALVAMVGGRAGARRHVSGLPHRPREGRGRDHAHAPS